MANFSFVVFAADDGSAEELCGEYPDIAHAVHEAKRFLFDVSHEIFTRANAGQVRIQVRDGSGAVIYDASVAYAVSILRACQTASVTY